MLGPQMPGHGAGVDCLVVALFPKADGECLDRSRSLRLHQRDHQRGIHSAGEERPQRHIGFHPERDRITQESFKLVGGIGIGETHAIGYAGFCDIAGRPVD